MSLLVAGSPGIGKTALLKQIADEMKMDTLFYYPQYADHGEIAGVTWVWVSPDGQEMRADRVPLAGVAPMFEAKRPTLCIIDDLGHAMPSIQNAFMQPIEERRIGIRKISDYIVFAASTNRREDNAGAKTITSTMSNRFYTTITLEPSVDDLIEHAVSSGWHEGMPSFLRFCHTKTDSVFELPKKDGSPYTTSRSLDKLQQMESAYELSGMTLWKDAPEVVTGTIGMGVGKKYIGYMRIRDEIAGLPEKVYQDPMGVTVPQSPDLQFALVLAVSQRCDVMNMGTMVKFLGRLSKELEVVGVLEATRRDKVLKNCTAYSEWVANNSKWIVGGGV
jgi:hypothetical protein